MSNITPTEAQIAKFRLQFNDVDVQNGDDEGGYWYTEIDRHVARDGSDLPGCACGCGFQVTNKKRNFIPGHDQRLMGILVFAHRNGLEVSWTDGGFLISGSPVDYARLVLSETGQAKLGRYMATEPKRTRKTRAAGVETADVAVEVADGADIPALGDDEAPSIEGAEQITVKIGRWEKEAIVTDRDQEGNPFEVQYNDAKGNPVVTTKFKLV